MKAANTTKPKVTAPQSTATSPETNRPALRPVFHSACSLRYLNQLFIAAVLGGERGMTFVLAAPDRADDEAQAHRQQQGRVGAIAHRLVDRIGHPVAHLARRFDGFPSLILEILDRCFGLRHDAVPVA